MKTKLITTVTAALLCGAALAADPPTTTERLKDAASDAGNALQRAGNVLADETREAWTKTKAYFSDDPETYKMGAAQKLKELGAEFAQLRQNSTAIKDRPYFQTRLLALEQQQQFAQQQLSALAPDEIRKGREGTRRGVDTTLERMEEHLDIAQKEVRDFTGATR
jgi:hypothetical protein